MALFFIWLFFFLILTSWLFLSGCRGDINISRPRAIYSSPSLKPAEADKRNLRLTRTDTSHFGYVA